MADTRTGIWDLDSVPGSIVVSGSNVAGASNWWVESLITFTPLGLSEISQVGDKTIKYAVRDNNCEGTCP